MKSGLVGEGQSRDSLMKQKEDYSEKGSCNNENLEGGDKPVSLQGPCRYTQGKPSAGCGKWKGWRTLGSTKRCEKLTPEGWARTPFQKVPEAGRWPLQLLKCWLREEEGQIRGSRDGLAEEMYRHRDFQAWFGERRRKRVKESKREQNKSLRLGRPLQCWGMTTRQ